MQSLVDYDVRALDRRQNIFIRGVLNFYNSRTSRIHVTSVYTVVLESRLATRRDPRDSGRGQT